MRAITDAPHYALAYASTARSACNGTSFVRDFEVLRPAAATRCTDGVIFSPNIAKYQPIAWDGNKAKKLKILTKFYQFSPYRLLNASHWPIPYTTFTKFSEFVGSFVLDHVLKFGEIRSRGSRAKGF